MCQQSKVKVLNNSNVKKVICTDLFSANRFEFELDFSKIGEPFLHQSLILIRDGVVVQKIVRAIQRAPLSFYADYLAAGKPLESGWKL